MGLQCVLSLREGTSSASAPTGRWSSAHRPGEAGGQVPTETKELWPTSESGVGLKKRRSISGIFPAIPPRTPHPAPQDGWENDSRWAGSPGLLTQVVVVHHGVGGPQPGPLLGKVVAELEKRCVLFQHAHNLHFHFVAQRLALWWRKEQQSPLTRLCRSSSLDAEPWRGGRGF